MLAQCHNTAKLDSCTSARLRKMIVLAFAFSICANNWARHTTVCNVLGAECVHFRQCSIAVLVVSDLAPSLDASSWDSRSRQAWDVVLAFDSFVVPFARLKAMPGTHPSGKPENTHSGAAMHCRDWVPEPAGEANWLPSLVSSGFELPFPLVSYTDGLPEDDFNGHVQKIRAELRVAGNCNLFAML